MANYRQLARTFARRYGVDPKVFLRQIQTESGFNPNAKSPAGAQGIAQFMPGTARSEGVNPYDPRSALQGAARLDAKLIKQTGSYRNALAAYNAGPGNIPAGLGYADKILAGKTPKGAVRTPSAKPTSYGAGTDKTALALSLIGFGNLAGNSYGGSDPLTTALLQATSKASPRTAAPSAGVPFASAGGAGSKGGLVPQVAKALAFARANGWKGQVTSGYRSYSQQKALYQRYLAGGNIAAKPGQSNHESGRAVDVTDIAGFARAMAKAPPGIRLYSKVAGDPVHWSTTGH